MPDVMALELLKRLLNFQGISISKFRCKLKDKKLKMSLLIRYDPYLTPKSFRPSAQLMAVNENEEGRKKRKRKITLFCHLKPTRTESSSAPLNLCRSLFRSLSEASPCVNVHKYLFTSSKPQHAIAVL